MKITWSLPVPGATLASGRGDLVRAWQLIGALRADGHEVEVVQAADHPQTAAAVSAYRSLVRHLLPQRAAHALRDLGRAAHAGVHAQRIARVAREQGADVIIETQVHPSDSGARAARACALPLLLDDCSPPAEEEALGCGWSGLARRAFARQAREAATLIVSSEALRERLYREGVSHGKITIVSNGVDLDAHDALARQSTRARLGFDGAPVIAFVGSFQPWHRVELLMEAAALVAFRPRLLLAGRGPGLDTALGRARDLGLGDMVTSLGPLPPAEIPGVLAACDVGVLPASNDYGQPMKLLEYAAAGLAIVAPDLPPVRALIEHERTGLLFPQGDAGALARALARLLADSSLRRRLGESARHHLAAGASWRERGRELALAAQAVVTPEPELCQC